jgi:hypothetical protein
MRSVNKGIDVVFGFERTNKVELFREIELSISRICMKKR